MRHLGLDEFTSPVDDLEKRQYHILSSLLSRRQEFEHSRLFPTLSEMVELRQELNLLLRNRNQVHAQLPRRLTDVDWEKKELVFEQTQSTSEDLEKMFELSTWALPHISAVIDEGVALYDFVEENIELEGVGIMPIYTTEGYFFVPEHRARILHILRFEMSLLHGEGHNFQAMKTRELHQVQESHTSVAPESIKLSLLNEHKELPNPATFVCETDLDFPYNETMLPVVKRKLMSRLVS